MTTIKVQTMHEKIFTKAQNFLDCPEIQPILARNPNRKPQHNTP